MSFIAAPILYSMFADFKIRIRVLNKQLVAGFAPWVNLSGSP